MSEPNVVYSGPINVQVSLASVLQAMLTDEDMKQLVREWLLKRLKEQAAAQTEGEASG